MRREIVSTSRQHAASAIEGQRLAVIQLNVDGIITDNFNAIWCQVLHLLATPWASSTVWFHSWPGVTCCSIRGWSRSRLDHHQDSLASINLRRANSAWFTTRCPSKMLKIWRQTKSSLSHSKEYPKGYHLIAPYKLMESQTSHKTDRLPWIDR